MIFKVFDSGIDKWTTKIKVFGKSFNELGIAINDAFETAINNIDNFDENISFWESLKNNLAPKNEQGESWLKNSLGEIISQENIDSYIKGLDLDSAKNKLSEIFSVENSVKSGIITWDQYFETQKNGNEYVIDLIKNTDDLSKLTGDDLVKANQAARASAVTHNQALQQQTLSAKAGQIALKGLAMAGSLFLVWAFTQAITFAVKKLDELIVTTEEAKEATKEAISSYESTTSEIETLTTKLEDLNAQIGKMDPVTDAEDIENLRLETAELEAQLAILREKQNIEKEEADKASQESLGRKTQSRYVEETITQTSFVDDGGNVTDTEIVTVTPKFVTEYEELDLAMAKYEEYKQQVLALEEELNNIDKEDNRYIEKSEAIADLTEKMGEARSHANELAISVKEQLSGLSSDESQGLKEEISEIINRYKDFTDALNVNTDVVKANAEAQKDIIEIIDVSTITDSIKQIGKQVEPQISALSDLLTSLYDGETWGFDANLIDHGMLEELRTTFAELEEDIGVEFPTEELENFYSVLADGVATEEEAKNAINDLATKWFYATNTLDNLNEKTAGAIEQQLEQMNVTNAQEVVQENLTGLMEAQAVEAEFLAAVTSDLNGETQNATQAFLEEAVSSDVAKNALIELAYAEIMVNSNDLDMTQKCAELQKLASAAFGAAAALKFETLMAESARYNGGYTEANAQAAWDQVLNEFSSFELPEVEVGFDTSKAASAGKDAGEEYKEALEKELSNMGDVLNYITDIIGDQIDAWNDQKDAAVDALEAERDAAIEALEAQKESLELQKEAIEDKIEAKEKEIQAIQDARKERQAGIDLQKKQYELERLQNQKTMLIYSDDKGYHYQTDVTGIRDAREAVDEAKEEIKIIAIEKEISVLEDQVSKIDDAIEGIDKQIDSTNDHYDKLIAQTEAYYDSLIKGLEDYKSRWEEIGEIEEQAKMQVALKNLGIETTDILNMSEDAFNTFKTQYLAILTEMYSGEQQMVDAINSVAQGIDYTTLETGLVKTKENIDNLNNADFNSVKSGLNDIATEMGNVGTSASTASSSTSAVSDDLKEINASTEGLDAKLSGISSALNEIPTRDKIDGLKDAFGLLALEIQNVANSLGVGEGSVSGLVAALQEISLLSLNGEEGGIITDFQNLKTAIDGVTSAINGGGGSMATEGGGLATGANGGAAQPTGEGGGSGLTGAIKEIGTATNETFGTGGESSEEGGESEGGEGEGSGVLGKFSAFKTAVDNVTKAIGTGEEEEEELSLISALQLHYTKAEETLPQVKARFEELLQSITACVDKLAELAGAMSSLGGGISLGGAGVVVAEPKATGTDPSKSFSTRVGKAFAKGTGAFKGLPKDTLALRSEYNQPELTIYPDDSIELTNSPTLSMLPKGTQILNEKQTKEVFNNQGSVGKAYVNGTLPNGLTPLSSVDLDKYNMLTALSSVPGNVEVGVKHLDMLNRNVDSIVENISKVNNINNNPTIEINNPQFTCTGVTGEQVLHEIQMQFSGLFLNAYQNAMKR